MAANVSCMSSMHAYLSIYVCVYVYVKSHLNFGKFSMHAICAVDSVLLRRRFDFFYFRFCEWHNAHNGQM